MGMQTFLDELNKTLRGLPEPERQEILSDYREHIEVGIAAGRSEKELLVSLGDPVTLGRLYRADHFVEHANNRFSPGTVAKAVTAVISLGLFNIIFVAVPAILITGVVLLLWLLTLLILLAGGGCLIGTLIYLFFPSMFVVGGMSGTAIFFTGMLLAIGLVSLAALLGIGMWFLTRFLARTAIRYLKFNISLFNVRRES